MSSKILLINFTERETEKLRILPVTFDRGFLSDIKELTEQEALIRSLSRDNVGDDGKKIRPVDNIDCYFPYPIYEYHAVFINLQCSDPIEKEFNGKTKKLTEEDKKNFTKYWLRRGISPIVIFLGDYKFVDLYNLGIPGIALRKVMNRDVIINSTDSERRGEMVKLLNEVKFDVIMPTHYYVKTDGESLFTQDDSEYKEKSLYWNNNNEDLAIFINHGERYSSTDRPRILVLPQFRNNIMVIEKFLRQFAKMFPSHLPELPHSDWVDSDAYYPTEIAAYDEIIDTLVADAQAKIKDLKEQKERTKEKYRTLRGLITQTGNELKASAIDVLRNVFKIPTKDGDEAKDSLLNEDVIVDIEGTKILAEVKGVKAENPSPLFIAQVWKHISQRKDKDIKTGALILNHDLETDPKDRSLAYKGEHEKGLEDIIFIDTRVMLDLGLAVIDYGMSPEVASKILFKTGRVSFNLQEYRDTEKHK